MQGICVSRQIIYVLFKWFVWQKIVQHDFGHVCRPVYSVDILAAGDKRICANASGDTDILAAVLWIERVSQIFSTLTLFPTTSQMSPNNGYLFSLKSHDNAHFKFRISLPLNAENVRCVSIGWACEALWCWRWP